jgi:hypothetical protein
MHGYRYPGDVVEASVVEAVAVLHRVRTFVDAMKIRFPEEAR